MMYLSEGCGGRQYVGFSNNLVDWSFEQPHVSKNGDLGILREVACAVTHYKSDDKLMLLDFFYQDKNGDAVCSTGKVFC